MKSLCTLALLGVFLLNLGACSTNPSKQSNNRVFDISKDPVLFSSQDEVAMGAQGEGEILKHYKPSADPALVSYIDSVGQRLAKVSDRKDISYHFAVLDSK